MTSDFERVGEVSGRGTILAWAPAAAARSDSLDVGGVVATLPGPAWTGAASVGIAGEADAIVGGVGVDGSVTGFGAALVFAATLVGEFIVP